MISVLCVDDDTEVLNIMSEVLTSKYVVYLATNGNEALKILETHSEISIVLADRYMDGMEGIELLSIIAQKYPTCSRLLVSGYTELVEIIPTIEKGIIHRFIKKPWSMQSLIRTLDSLHKEENIA